MSRHPHTRTALALALALASLATGGCDGAAAGAAGSAELHSVGTGGHGADTGEPWAHDPDAVDRLRHHGQRVFEAWDRTTTPARHIAYRETVSTDGKGHFAIDVVEVLTPVDMDPAVFTLLQKQREGYTFGYRDFSIHDMALFQENYDVVGASVPGEVAGRPCTTYQLVRPGWAGFRVAVDEETGHVLAYQEYDSQGRVVAAMTYETYSSEPAQVAWFVPQTTTTSLDPTGDLTASLGFEPVLPTLVPQGYEPIGLERVIEPSGLRWLKVTYTDGLQPLFYLFTDPAGHAPTQPGLPSGPGPDPDGEPDQDDVFVNHQGVVTTLHGFVRGNRYVIVGKVGEPELLDMLNSAVVAE